MCGYGLVQYKWASFSLLSDSRDEPFDIWGVRRCCPHKFLKKKDFFLQTHLKKKNSNKFQKQLFFLNFMDPPPDI